MPEFSAQRLASWTGGRWTAEPGFPLSGFCVDSRQLQRGQVFIALKTEKRDGHDFLAAALAAGAGAAIVSQPQSDVALPQLVVTDPLTAFQSIAREHRRAFRGQVVGISGSAGKTSTKDLLALLLGGGTCGVPATGDHSGTGVSASGTSFTGRVLATEGNLNNYIGVPLTLTRLDSETHDFAVVEAGISVPGEMRTLADMIEPDVALITLIAPAHTQDLGGIEGVASEKAKLPAATRPAGVAVFSRDTAGYAAFRELGVRTLIVERTDELRPAEPPRNIVLFTLLQRADETAITLAYGTPPPLTFAFRRVSDGMAQNAVLAICAALWVGVPIATIQARLQEWRPARLRGEIRREPGRLLYLDCYNANPASMADALEAFEAIADAAEPRLYVIGSMEELGPDAPGYHRTVGRSLKLRPHDVVFFIGAQADSLRAGAMEGSGTSAQVHVAVTAEAAGVVVRAWRGSIFVKGSRRYRLEQLLEPAAAVVGTEHPAPAECGAAH